jgi:hypothetical protein
LENQIRDINNFKIELESIDRRVDQIRNSLIKLGLNYANKISGKLNNDKFYQSRDNIIYRVNCCRFLNLKSCELREEYELKDFNTTFLENAEFPILWMTDSLIFNLSSLFDYLGGLLEFIVGDEGKNEMKWNSIYNSFRNKEPHSKTVFTNYVMEIHSGFVDKLFGFRSTVIHNKVQSGGFNYTYEIMSDKKTLHQFCSAGFLNSFKALKKEYPNQLITLHFANFWMMNKSLDYLFGLIELADEHIEQNRKITRENEIIVKKQ